jgi:hypothetical protein
LGNPLSLILHPDFVEKHNLKDKLSDIKTLGQGIGGVGGSVALTAAVASEIWIGPWPFKNVPVMLSEDKAFPAPRDCRWYQESFWSHFSSAGL